jgi:hypothetical protein
MFHVYNVTVCLFRGTNKVTKGQLDPFERHLFAWVLQKRIAWSLYEEIKLMSLFIRTGFNALGT